MSYRVVPADLKNNRADIIRLWHVKMRERWTRSTLERRFDWLYGGNPLGMPMTRLVVHTESGKVVGTASAIPRMMLIDGKPVRAGLLGDFVIDFGHRLAGPALMVQRALAKESIEHGFQFLYGYPNKGAEALFPRLRFKKLHESSSWVHLLKTGNKIAKYIHPVASALAGVLVDRVLAVNDARLQLGNMVSVKSRAVCQPGSMIDSLFDSAARRYRFVPVRSADFLRWRYFDNPLQSARMFCVDRPSGEPAGYVVYDTSNSKGVVDVLDVFVDGDARLFEATMIRFVRHIRKSTSAKSVCVGFGGAGYVGESLRKLMFKEHLEHRQVIAWVDKKKQPEDLVNVVYDPGAWQMFDGELDI